MRKKTINAIVTLFIGACALVIVSCNKSTVDSNTTTATDNALAEEEFMRLLPMVNSLCHTYKGKGVERVASGPHYPTVTCTDTLTSPGWPRTMIINYGTNTKDSSDSRTRSGIITVYFPLTYWKVIGSGANITFTNYSVTSGGATTSIVGSVRVVHLKDSTFTESVGNAILTQGSNVMSYSCSRTFYWEQGHNDSVASHSSYSITGNGSGMDRNKVNYTSTIQSPLIYQGNCPYLASGSIQLVPAGNSNRTVNYGVTCSSSANVLIDGNTYSVTLQ